MTYDFTKEQFNDPASGVTKESFIEKVQKLENPELTVLSHTPNNP